MYVVDLSDGSAPTLVESLRGEHVLEMSGSFAKTALLTGRGVAKKASTGSSEAEAYAELSGLDGMLAQVAFGAKHTVALTHTGEVYTLGSGECGQLGHGNTSSCDQPKLVQTLANRAVAQVACGKAHTLALTAEGDIYSWGAADDGQLGIGRTSPSFVPRYLSALQGTPIAMIASGAAHCAALSVYGRVFTWGEALCGQLGLGTPLRSQASPCEVPDLPDLQAIACGEFHTVVLSAEGSVYSWGLSTRGPPTSRKMTPKPELLTTLTEPITSLSCGGGSTLLIGESGDVLCWPGAGREMGVVPLAPGLKASRTACAGVGALIFVETSITHITPSCAPLAGGSFMELHGAGFYESDGIVLRLTHASGQQKLVRGKLGTDRNGGLIVTAEAPSFSESGPGDVSVAVSFEEGEGETFTTTPVMMRVYSPPSLAKAFPCCAPAALPSKVLLKASEPWMFFEAPDAKAFFYDPSGAVFASVPATYSQEESAMVIETPLCEEAVPDAIVRIALDGQSAAPDSQPFYLHAPIEIEKLTPRVGPAAGGTKITISGSSLFSSPHLSARFTVVPPPPPPTPPPPPEPVPVEEGEEGAEPAAEEPAAEGEAEEAAPVPEPEPPAVRLEEGMVFEIEGIFDDGVITFTMPEQAGVAELGVELTVDGVHYLPTPTAFTLTSPLSVTSISPAVGTYNGGTTLQIYGKGVVDSPDLSVLFVKGATRKVVPATYDLSLGCATCVAPSWPPALDMAKSVANAIAANEKALADAAEAGEEPPEVEEPPPLDLTDAGDSIVELSLNGQQWTTDCKHFAYVAEPTVTACDPESGPLEGGVAVKVVATHVSDTGVVKAKFTKIATVEDGEAPAMPGEGEEVLALEVEATVTAEGDGAEVTAPVFEGMEEPFDTAVQLSNDGQIYGPSFAVFKYDAGGGKGKKK